MPELLPAHGVVVLAAGASTRLGRPKQFLMHRGETLVHRAARLALTTRPRDATIVLGHDPASVFSQVEKLPIRRVDCADWKAGMGASLRAGVAALAAECSGALIVLCDQPALDERHLAALCVAWRSDPARGAASFYAGRLGAPALLPRAWFANVAIADRGARDLLDAWRDRIGAIANEALAFDVDKIDDLRHLT